MAIIPMKFVTIVGPIGDFDEVIHKCIVNRQFHPESAINIINKLKVLFPFSQENPYAALLQKYEELAEQVGYSLDYHDFENNKPELDDVSAYAAEFREKYNVLYDEYQELSRLVLDNEQIIRQLEHIQKINTNLDDFFNLEYAKFRFGRMRRDTYEGYLSHFVSLGDLFVFPTSFEKDNVYLIYMTTRAAQKKIDSLFLSLRFERIRISDKVIGTAEESIERLTKESAETKERISELSSMLAQFKNERYDKFLTYYSYMRYLSDSFDIRKYAAHTAESFYLLGWVPVAVIREITSNIDKFKNITYIVDDPLPNGDPPPIKLNNPKIFRPFESYVKMYGLPSYNEIDPTPLMAITYTLLFGIMFGDVGQGIVVSLIGLLMWKLKGMWLGRILIYAGISSACFGFVYGSVFGFEHLLNYRTFKVLESENTNTMLLLAVFAGVLLISIAMVFNIINGIKQKNFLKILFSPNGLAGFIFYWAIIIAILPILGFGKSVLTPWYILVFVVLPLLMMFLREPLSKLVAKRPDWQPKSWGGYVLENVFELVEVLLSYVTNTISFLRVGAFALSHAGMMMVVFLLARGTGSADNPIAVVIGNIVVMGIEGLLVGIQVLRLEFYELFGRFYSGEGQPYTPFIIQYKSQNK